MDYLGSDDRNVRSFLNYLGAIVGFAAYVMLRFAGFPAMAILGVLTIALVCCGIGWICGRLLANAIDCEGKFAKGLMWLQLIAWLIPAFGYFLSSVVGQISHGSSGDRARMRILGCVCALLSFINGMWGVHNDMHLTLG